MTAMISFANCPTGRIAPLRGEIPINATFQQYIPILDEDGARISLTPYDFELTFRDEYSDDVVLRLSTVTGEITKTTDDDGATLLVTIAPADMSDLSGPYKCSFAAKDTDDLVYLLGDGTVVFLDAPAAFA